MDLSLDKYFIIIFRAVIQLKLIMLILHNYGLFIISTRFYENMCARELVCLFAYN